MHMLTSAARDRAQLADDLAEGHPGSALALYREAGLLAMAALMAGHTDQPTPLDRDELIENLETMAANQALPLSEGELTRFIALVRSRDPLEAERSEPETTAKLVRTAHNVVARLNQLVEPRSLSEVRFQRTLRVGTVSLVLAGALVIAGAMLLGRDNIALHCPVTTSGLHPTAAAPLGGLTDGVTSGSFGVHTSLSENPWVQVDLTAVYRLDRVKVYNRGDGWFDDGLPMVLQVSENGKDFVDVETRSGNFGQLLPWSVKGRGRKARYVRVKGARGTYVALSEIEVFGRKP
jgi:hypothetical protein